MLLQNYSNMQKKKQIFQETNRYLVLSVNMWQVETLNEPNFDHWSLNQNSTLNLPTYSFGPETFFMSVYVLLYIELHTNTQSKRSIHFLLRYSKHFILHLCGT